MSESPSAETITRSSKSNLALAFVSLPKERRDDMTVFYAFCRVVDDIADEPVHTPEEKRVMLDQWSRALVAPVEGEPALAAPVRKIIRKYSISIRLFQEIIDGVTMDVEPAPFKTFEDLQGYCYLVASAVGLVSIEIFGYQNPACREYALQLGYALQLTNIIRDVGQDYRNGRIYLPSDDLESFGVTEADLAAGRLTPAFREMMKFQAARAKGFYQTAVAALPPEDRNSMSAAEIMRHVYHRLLLKIERNGFQVLDTRFALSKLEKIGVILGVTTGFLR